MLLFHPFVLNAKNAKQKGKVLNKSLSKREHIIEARKNAKRISKKYLMLQQKRKLEEQKKREEAAKAAGGKGTKQEGQQKEDRTEAVEQTTEQIISSPKVGDAKTGEEKEIEEFMNEGEYDDEEEDEEVNTKKKEQQSKKSGNSRRATSSYHQHPFSGTIEQSVSQGICFGCVLF